MRKLVFALVSFLLIIPCSAEIIIVDNEWPYDFNNIQAAIDYSSNGDFIIVFPGTYTGEGNRDIDFLGKAITVRSTDPNNPNIVAGTVVDCQNYGRGFIFQSDEDANSVLSGLTITNGYSSCGSGIYCQIEESRPTIANCVIINNTANTEGVGGGGIFGCDGLITNCIISDNSAGMEGGGLFACYGRIENCLITNNSAYTGGGLSACGGVITNCIISDNTAKSGAGLAFFEGTLANCTITGNSAGGLLICSGHITNSIIWGNGPEQISGGFPPTVTYSDVQGGYPGLGNIDADPCFLDADANDYHLKSEGWRWDTKRSRWTYDDVTSRCIDAGNPGSPLGDELLSVPDDPNNEWGENLRIDMGSFGGTAEASIPPYDWALLGDLTNDGIVDLKDYAYQAADWLNSAGQQPGDLNRDGLIDIDDLALLIDDWLGQTTWH